MNNPEGAVHRVGYYAKGRAGCSIVRRSELGVIEEVEELGAELDIQPLHDRSPFEDRKVEINHALLAKGSVDAGLITEAPGIVRNADAAIVTAGRGKAGRVEPFVDS